MTEIKINKAKTAEKIFFGIFLLQIFSLAIFAQSAVPIPAETRAQSEKNTATSNADLPQVTQIDAVALAKILKPNGKPVLVNFWATWCGPCVEEFPELVKINGDYREKLDVAVISLDDLAELNRDVPKFLAKVNAKMPAYLLKTADDDAAIQSVDKSWQGGLPFTILIDADGTAAYTRQGTIDPKVLREQIDKIISK